MLRVSRVLAPFQHKENTKFIYNGQDVFVDDNAGTLTKYLNGSGIDNKLRVQTGSDVKYFLSDHLGSTNALTNSSGAIAEQTAYDAFGNATTNLSTRYQFTGREYDNFTGLHYYRARWYDSNLGRFISEDPIGFEGKDINWFSYVHNNPLMYFDPEGTQVRSDSRYEPYSKEKNREMVQYIMGMPDPTEPLRCGPSPGLLEWLVPDRIGGFGGYFGSKFNINPACQSHDNCYSSCGTPKEQCDEQLRQDILNLCEQTGGEYLDQCKGYADIYYKGVTDQYWSGWGLNFGRDAYRNAQKDKNCDGTKYCPPTPPVFNIDPCSKYGNWKCK